MPSAPPPSEAISPQPPFGFTYRGAELPVLGFFAVSLALYPFLPVAAWVSGLIFAAGYIGYQFSTLPRMARRAVGACAGLAFFVHVVVTLARQPYDIMGTTEWFDDQAYFINAGHIAEAWRAGFFPELSRKGSPPYLGTLHTGYERMLAGLFYVGGARLWLGILFNGICVASLPVLCALLSRSLFDTATRTAFAAGADARPEEAGRPGFGVYATPAVATAFLCAIHPALYYWSGLLLKDSVLATLFIVAVLLLVDLYRLRSPALLAAFVAMLVWVAIFRNYAALSLLAAAFIYAMAGLRRRTLLWALFWLLISILGMRYTDLGHRYMSQLLASLLNQLPPELHSVGGVMTHFAAAIPRLFFSPYAWVRAEGDRPFYALYPGMWYLYLVIYPLALAGFIRAVRTDHRQSIIPASAILASSFILLAAYGGNAPRQRLSMEVLAIVYAGMGLFVPGRRWAFLITYVVIILFAASQLIRLTMRQ